MFQTSLQIARVVFTCNYIFFPVSYGFLVPKRLCCHFVAPRQTHLCCPASCAAAVPRGAPLPRRDEAVVWRRLATMMIFKEWYRGMILYNRIYTLQELMVCSLSFCRWNSFSQGPFSGSMLVFGGWMHCLAKHRQNYSWQNHQVAKGCFGTAWKSKYFNKWWWYS